jgi:Kdo2-lipid IVA lauroyltransferase/acyltransferase
MYYLIYGTLYLLSLLPWFVMYGISDLLAFLTWNVFGYRKDVVLGNLAIAFPEKPEAERVRIAKAFYRNFTDAIVESIKVISMGEKALRKKFVPNMEQAETLSKLGKNIHIHAMHNFSWEIVNLGVSMVWKMPFMGVYMPIGNKHLEKIFRKVRSRYGTILVPATDFKTKFRGYEQQRYSIALVADQNPGSPAHAYWANFFSKPAPFVRGPEKSARSRDLAVFFGHFFPVRRGVYSIDLKMITLNAAGTTEGELTLSYIRYVEECIRKQPANYLWSHRRWKHAWKPEYQESTLEPLKH